MGSPIHTSALIRAIKVGNTKRALDLIKSGADIHARDVSGWTPLIHAAEKGHIAVLEGLVKAGADVNEGRSQGFTALFVAVLSGRIEAVELLLRVGAKPHLVDGVPMARLPLRHLKSSERIIALLRNAS